MRDYLNNKNVFESQTAQLLTKDGLLPCENITVKPRTGSRGAYDFFLNRTQLEIFSAPHNLVATNYLAAHPELWVQAAIQITYYPAICGSASVFGVPFEHAIKIALKNGYMRSKFFLPESFDNGHHQTLLLQLDAITHDGQPRLQLQAWHHTPGASTARYLHAISSDFQDIVFHFDCAIIDFSDDDLALFLRESRKVKSEGYQKRFRLDGEIPVFHMHNLARVFFGTEELYNEAFEVCPLATEA